MCISVTEKYHEIFKILDYCLMYSYCLVAHVCVYLCVCVCVCTCALLGPEPVFHYASIVIYKNCIFFEEFTMESVDILASVHCNDPA